MALVRKDSIIKLRLPQELSDSYRALCDSRNVTVSAEVRRLIEAELSRHQRQLEEAAERRRRADYGRQRAEAQLQAETVLADQLASPVQAPSLSPAPTPKVELARGPMSLSERRALEKEAKRRKARERADKW